MSNKKNILIVDSAKTIRKAVRMILENIGKDLFNVLEAGNSIGMYNNIYIEGKYVDCIIMDLNLKSENGIDLIKELKEKVIYKDIPIIVLTSSSEIKDVTEVKELGVEQYILKPINKEKLKTSIYLAVGFMEKA